MLARTPLWQLAIEWLEKQPRSKRYSWNSRKTCACAQIAKAIGREKEWAAFSQPSLKDVFDYYSDRGPPSLREWYLLNRIAEEPGWTFGALLDRLRCNL